MSDGAGVQCDRCGGWVTLHRAVIDGRKVLTGKCVNCGLYIDVPTETSHEASTHLYDYDAYPGKGPIIVEIRRPGQSVKGCRYENWTEARTFAWKSPTIPCGSVSVYSVAGADGHEFTRRWPAKKDDEQSFRAGEIDAATAVIEELRHSLAYDLPMTEQMLEDWAWETKTVGTPYAKQAYNTIINLAHSLRSYIAQGDSYEEAAIRTIGLAEATIREAEDRKEASA